MKAPLFLPFMQAGARRNAVAATDGARHAGRAAGAATGKADDFANALAEATGPVAHAAADKAAASATAFAAKPPAPKASPQSKAGDSALPKPTFALARATAEGAKTRLVEADAAMMVSEPRRTISTPGPKAAERRPSAAPERPLGTAGQRPTPVETKPSVSAIADMQSPVTTAAHFPRTVDRKAQPKVEKETAASATRVAPDADTDDKADIDIDIDIDVDMEVDGGTAAAGDDQSIAAADLRGPPQLPLDPAPDRASSIPSPPSAKTTDAGRPLFDGGAARLSNQTRPASPVAKAVAAKPEVRLPASLTSPSATGTAPAASAVATATAVVVPAPVSVSANPSPAQTAPVRTARPPASFASATAKGQASPLDRSRSVLAPSAPALPVTGSIGSLFAADKGDAPVEKKTSDSPATAAAKTSRPAQPATNDPADPHDPDDSEDSPAAGTREFDPLAAAVAGMAAPIAAFNARSAADAATTGTAAAASSAAVAAAKAPHAAAAEVRFTNAASASASWTLPAFSMVTSTVTAPPHDKGAPQVASDPAAPPATTQAPAVTHPGHESDAATAKLSAQPSAAPSVPSTPDALVAARPATVDAATLGAHLASQSFSLTPGADLPALFEAAPVPTPAAAFWTQAAEDPSLHGALMNDAAHVSLDAGAAGEITLHLRIKDGVADVRFEGAAAQTLEIRPQELRIALASEGLSLGGFESGQSAPRDGQLESDRRDNSPAHAPTPTSLPSLAVPVSADRAAAAILTRGGRLHVTA